MIMVRPAPDPYGCNACKKRQGTTEVEFTSMIVMLCDECVEELKGAL